MSAFDAMLARLGFPALAEAQLVELTIAAALGAIALAASGSSGKQAMTCWKRRRASSRCW